MMHLGKLIAQAFNPHAGLGVAFLISWSRNPTGSHAKSLSSNSKASRQLISSVAGLTVTRLAFSLIKHYRSGDQGSTIDVVRANSNDYWQRTDEEPLFDGGEKQETNAEAERHKAFTQHMMYWLGSVHRKQSQEYAERLERLLPEISDDLKNMVKEHVAALKAKQKKAPKGTGDACTLSNRHSPGA